TRRTRASPTGTPPELPRGSPVSDHRERVSAGRGRRWRGFPVLPRLRCTPRPAVSAGDSPVCTSVTNSRNGLYSAEAPPGRHEPAQHGVMPQIRADAGETAGSSSEPAVAYLRERRRSENFPVALRVLPGRLRTDLRRLYDVARLIDDAGDEAPGDR